MQLSGSVAWSTQARWKLTRVGVQLSASDYSLYAQGLAVAGYAVVQYDFPLLPLWPPGPKSPDAAIEVCSHQMM